MSLQRYDNGAGKRQQQQGRAPHPRRQRWGQPLTRVHVRLPRMWTYKKIGSATGVIFYCLLRNPCYPPPLPLSTSLQPYDNGRERQQQRRVLRLKRQRWVQPLTRFCVRLPHPCRPKERGNATSVVIGCFLLPRNPHCHSPFCHQCCHNQTTIARRDNDSSVSPLARDDNWCNCWHASVSGFPTPPPSKQKKHGATTAQLEKENNDNVPPSQEMTMGATIDAHPHSAYPAPAIQKRGSTTKVVFNRLLCNPHRPPPFCCPRCCNRMTMARRYNNSNMPRHERQ